MNRRNTTIDVAKGIGIILVVAGHNWSVLHPKGEVFRIIFSFHLPLFFFLSGIFLKQDSPLKAFLAARVDLLLRPYFIVLTTLGVIQLLWAILHNKLATQQVYYFWGMLYSTGETISWAPFWFLTNLFISSIFALIVIKIVKHKHWIGAISIILLIFGVHYINIFWDLNYVRGSMVSISAILSQLSGRASQVPGLPWSLDLLPITAALMLWGYLLGNLVKNMSFNVIGFGVSLMLFSSLHYYFDETIDLNNRIYGAMTISVMQMATGIYLTISCAALLQRYSVIRRPLVYLGSGTLFILMFHDTTQTNSYELLAKISDFPAINAAISFGLGIGLPIILWETVKRLKFCARLLFPAK